MLPIGYLFTFKNQGKDISFKLAVLFILVCSGRGRYHYASAGEGHPHTRGGAGDGEEPAHAAAEGLDRAGPGSL